MSTFSLTTRVARIFFSHGFHGGREGATRRAQTAKNQPAPAIGLQHIVLKFHHWCLYMLVISISLWVNSLFSKSQLTSITYVKLNVFNAAADHELSTAFHCAESVHVSGSL